jgi:hypothetical protein
VSTDSFTGDSETIVSRRLLALGESGVREREWIRYADLGVTLADIPEMIRLMRDVALNASSNPAEHWAPLHAWRALAQLGTIELVEPLIELHAELGGDDYLFQDLPRAMAHVGRAALPPLSLALDRGDYDPLIRGSFAEAIAAIGNSDPAVRATAAQLLVDQLRQFEGQDPALNALIVGALVDLEAVEHAQTLERVMTSGNVDVRFVGDWEDVQIELGLLDARLTPRRVPDYFPNARLALATPRESRERRSGARAKRKSKRKLSKAARRRNRR